MKTLMVLAAVFTLSSTSFAHQEQNPVESLTKVFYCDGSQLKIDFMKVDGQVVRTVNLNSYRYNSDCRTKVLQIYGVTSGN